MKLELTNLVHEKDIDNDIFMNNIESKLNININQNEIVENDEWIDMMEFTIPYIEKALYNPNKNIVTENEVVKVEKIKKVTVDSIKHLSKNTNLISKLDKKTGDVIPSKILNSFKEESFITYENRFIFTLIKLMDDFIFLRTNNEKNEFKGKVYQKANYEAKTKLKRRNVKFNFEYSVEHTESKKERSDLANRIEKIEEKIKTLKQTDMYILLKTKRASLVTSPLKMTNVLLKNVNFQYAVKLWMYLNNHLDARKKAISMKKEFEENGQAKKFTDETFLLNYLIINNISNATPHNNKKKLKIATLDPKEQKQLTDSLIDKIIEINPELAENELRNMILERYLVFKKKKVISLEPIQEVFEENIKTYLMKVEKLRLK